MKYRRFFPDGFHVFEDKRAAPPHELRLTISSHGQVGGMSPFDNTILPDRLISILCENFDISIYRHIRLLFCHSADKGWLADSFAATFSKSLPNSDRVIVEAYHGKISVPPIDYLTGDDKAKVRSHPNANYPIIYQHSDNGKVKATSSKKVLASDYEPRRAWGMIFRPLQQIEEYTNDISDQNLRQAIILNAKKCFESSRDSNQKNYETCDPVFIGDILNGRVFFCNGKSSRNINDFR
ncbi:hypothetical protein HGO23_05855 [Xenorhabdus budapestensis]|uniref:Uncharacterized protein n=1 Tax=Xenorhabdus budapestensis TaxID=290110 RepID=A0ABX7VMC8_XENBU|nr:hypothetical protein [Xenorhabdus budapestensis]QTL40872.1 hypothetical protein HGO23_05855 [Xenorhabdus budapestensis]